MKELSGIVYAHCLERDGNIDEQTKARCDKALSLYKAGRINKLFITVGAGRIDFRKKYILTGEKMREYFLKNGMAENFICFSPRGLNTAGETDRCLSFLSDGERVIAISSWYHLPRIWVIWLTRKRLVRLAASYKGTYLYEIFLEPLKFANFIIRPFKSSKRLN